jgi:hypothetical protein
MDAMIATKLLPLPLMLPLGRGCYLGPSAADLGCSSFFFCFVLSSLR